jgi:ABC-type antimicrobial peptide transport system permease subunit
MSAVVGQRTREIGVRMALGARARDVMGLVVRQSGRLVLLGVAFGLLGALVLSRFLRSLLYGVTPAGAPGAPGQPPGSRGGAAP